jgi:hypothetical protein
MVKHLPPSVPWLRQPRLVHLILGLSKDPSPFGATDSPSPRAYKVKHGTHGEFDGHFGVRGLTVPSVWV